MKKNINRSQLKKIHIGGKRNKMQLQKVMFHHRNKNLIRKSTLSRKELTSIKSHLKIQMSYLFIKILEFLRFFTQQIRAKMDLKVMYQQIFIKCFHIHMKQIQLLIYQQNLYLSLQNTEMAYQHFFRKSDVVFLNLHS